MKIRIVKGTTKISSKGDIVFHTFGGDMEFNAGQKNIWHGEQGNEVGDYEKIEFSDSPSPVRFECNKIKEYNIGVNETRLVRLKVDGKNNDIKRKIKFEKDNNNISLSTSEWEAENEWILETKITGKKYGNTIIKVLVNGLHMNSIKIKCIHYKDVFSEEEVERLIKDYDDSHIFNKSGNVIGNGYCICAADKGIGALLNDKKNFYSEPNLKSQGGNGVRLESSTKRAKVINSLGYIHSEFSIKTDYYNTNNKPTKLEGNLKEKIENEIKNKIGYHVYYLSMHGEYHVMTLLINNTNPCKPLFSILDQGYIDVRNLNFNILENKFVELAQKFWKNKNQNAKIIYLWKIRQK